MKVFITGGTTGIGLELSKLYLIQGWDVAVCGRDLTKYPEEIKDKYKNLSLYQVDVTKREELIKAVSEFAGVKGLDLMIASAGRSVGSKSALPDFKVSYEVIGTNILGVMYSFEAALSSMLPKKSGHLVAIASVAGMVGLPGAASYSASKAAVLKLCESYSMDLRNHGIDVSAIAPGFIDTPLTQKNDHRMPFLMSAELGAEKIKKAIDRKKVLYIFPLPMKILIYILEKMPRFIYRKIMSKSQEAVYKKH